MSEVFIAFMVLITIVQLYMITNRLIRLEEKINALKENKDGTNEKTSD